MQLSIACRIVDQNSVLWRQNIRAVKEISRSSFNSSNSSPVKCLDVDGLVVPGGVEPQQLVDGDGHPHRVGPLGLHDVRHRADQILAAGKYLVWNSKYLNQMKYFVLTNYKTNCSIIFKRFSFQILYFQNWSMYCSNIINLEGTGREQGWLLGGLSGGWESPAQKRGPPCPCPCRWPGPGRGQTSAWTRCPAPPGARTCPYWPGARPPSWPGSLQMSSRGGYA